MNIGVILASGNGERMISSNEKKCFIEVLNKPLFSYSLSTFIDNENIDYIYLVLPTGYIDKAKKSVSSDKVRYVIGGNSRKESVFNAIRAIKNDFIDTNPFILVHDAARALLSPDIIDEHIKLKDTYDVLFTAVKSVDSLVVLILDKYEGNIDRNKIYKEQTPTSSYLNNYLYAFNNTKLDDVNDDVSILKEAGFNIKLVLGNNYNFKVTTDEDLSYLIYLIENKK